MGRVLASELVRIRWDKYSELIGDNNMKFLSDETKFKLTNWSATWGKFAVLAVAVGIIILIGITR